MKTLILILSLQMAAYGQTIPEKLNQAEIMLNTANYHEAALIIGSMIPDSSLSIETHLFAASVFCLDGQFDRAFAALFFITRKKGYHNMHELSSNSDLNGLHADKRWEMLLLEIRNQQKLSALAELKRNILADSVEQIQILYEKMIKDSAHYFFDIDEIDDYARSLFNGKIKIAITILNANHRYFSKHAETAILLGEAYEISGDKYMARQSYEEALALQPDATDTYILLKKIAVLTRSD